MWGFSLARTQPHRLKPVLLGLVGRAFGHPDDVDAAIIGCSGLACPAACGDARRDDALLREVFDRVGGAGAGDFGGDCFLGMEVSDDYGAAPRFILQAESGVIENAFANVVDARAERFAERAIADLAGL